MSFFPSFLTCTQKHQFLKTQTLPSVLSCVHSCSHMQRCALTHSSSRSRLRRRFQPCSPTVPTSRLTSKDREQVLGQGLSGRGVTTLAGQVAQRQDCFIHQAGAVGLQLIWTHRATAQGGGSQASRLPSLPRGPGSLTSLSTTLGKNLLPLLGAFSFSFI